MSPNDGRLRRANLLVKCLVTRQLFSSPIVAYDSRTGSGTGRLHHLCALRTRNCMVISSTSKRNSALTTIPVDYSFQWCPARRDGKGSCRASSVRVALARKRNLVNSHLPAPVATKNLGRGERIKLAGAWPPAGRFSSQRYIQGKFVSPATAALTEVLHDGQLPVLVNFFAPIHCYGRAGYAMFAVLASWRSLMWYPPLQGICSWVVQLGVRRIRRCHGRSEAPPQLTIECTSRRRTLVPQRLRPQAHLWRTFSSCCSAQWPLGNSKLISRNSRIKGLHSTTSRRL